ncbi:uridine kinase family protein [Angustibacter aerolatus]|uniref:Adenylate kinase n=1 Tax=Angustibacter aerolatus TaxID=1162965 RepID=A0ABQ6JC94_9ACTN|nr:(d)CMP kinase [Angustibacter aerolatus]GMA85083.1 adenylate kinase [Angustibacter aerolatus]
MSRPFVIGVDGPSGSGKSVLADRLAAALGAAVIRLDDVYPGWGGLEASVPRVVAWALAPLADGRPARWRRFDWVAGRYAEWHTAPRRDVVVLEGVGAGARACATHLDVLLWVEAPEAERYGRAMRRDGVGYRPHWRQWAAAEQVHHRREGTRERADVVLRG